MNIYVSSNKQIYALILVHKYTEIDSTVCTKNKVEKSYLHAIDAISVFIVNDCILP